jgi:hypothetical protein
VFYQLNSYSNHVRTCLVHKKGFSKNLENAKERYSKKKKQKRGMEAVESWCGEDLDVDQEPPNADVHVGSIN